MKLILVSVVVATFITTSNDLAGGTALATNAVPLVHLKEFLIGEQEVQLKAEVDPDSGILQIRQRRRSDNSITNDIIAKISVSKLGPCGFDFAMTPTGDVLWVFAHELSVSLGGYFCQIYPLIPERGDKEKYVQPTKKRGTVEKPYDAVVSISLTTLLRDLAKEYFQRGKHLSLGHKPSITYVRLESTNAASVIVTGNIGENYTFRGTVILGKDNGFLTKDFAIDPIIK